MGTPELSHNPYVEAQIYAQNMDLASQAFQRASAAAGCAAVEGLTKGSVAEVLETTPQEA